MTTTHPLPVYDFAANLIVTDMVSSATVSIGPELDTPATPGNPGPPIVAKGICHPGTSTNTHYHPGYYHRIFIDGSYRMDGVDYATGDALLAESRALTGEEGPLGEGSSEFCFFESTYAAIPFFLDNDDPRLADFLDKMAPKLEQMTVLTPPGADETARNVKLDHERDGINYPGLTAFPCQLGKGGFGVEPRDDDPSCFAILVRFEPGVVLVDRLFENWGMAVVLRGDCTINDTRGNADLAVSLPPQTPIDVEIGAAGAEAMLYFSSGADAAMFLKG